MEAHPQEQLLGFAPFVHEAKKSFRFSSYPKQQLDDRHAEKIALSAYLWKEA